VRIVEVSRRDLDAPPEAFEQALAAPAGRPRP
jgi:hypothetical protein